MTHQHWSTDDLNTLHAEVMNAASLAACDGAAFAKVLRRPGVTAKQPGQVGRSVRLVAALSTYAVIAAAAIYFVQPAGQGQPQPEGRTQETLLPICLFLTRRYRGMSLHDKEETIYRAARGNLGRLLTYLSNCNLCTFKSEAQTEVATIHRDELAQVEAQTYAGARGNLGSLRGYLNNCNICAFKTQAAIEISDLERDQRARLEEATYRAAIGNLNGLRVYVATCQICSFKGNAENAIKQLERTIAFQIKNNHANAVSLSFYSQRDKSRTWPTDGKVYILRHSETQNYRLSCDVGETICYGAWVNGSLLNPYWGAGYGGKQPCTNCCLTCSTATAPPFVLEPREAQQPVPTITFRMRNNHPNFVALSFYSKSDASRSWPGGGQVYPMRDRQLNDYRLTCQAGEQICYGAWVDGSLLSPYWGTGYGGRQGCANCCYVCSGQETDPIDLNPSDAKVPVPTLTWHVKNNYPYTIDLVFYADTRPNQWPGENQVYTLNDRTVHNIPISCQANERICYGAWPRGNPGGIGWGLGYNRGLRCSNCCWTCNGGETEIISLDP